VMGGEIVFSVVVFGTAGTRGLVYDNRFRGGGGWLA
jgi:hypothetical protein